MLAKFDGLDYHIFLDKSKRELDKLEESSLETALMNFKNTENLGKIVVVKTGQNRNPEGAELILDSFGNVTIILNDLAKSYLRSYGQIFTTYLLTENKIHIEYTSGGLPKSLINHQKTFNPTR